MAVRAGISVQEMLSAHEKLAKGAHLAEPFGIFFFFCSASVEVKIPNSFGTQHESVCVSKRVEQLRFICTVHPKLRFTRCFFVNLRPETLRILSAKLR